MAKQTINIGTNENDGSGDKLRDAMTKINANFTELYASTSTNTNISLANNAVEITNVNGNLSLIPNGTGQLIVTTGALFNSENQPTSDFVVQGSDGSDVLTVNPQHNNVGINTTANVAGLYVSGNLNLAGTQANIIANVYLGDSTHSIRFDGKINTDIIPLTNVTYDLGSSALRWAESYVANAYVTNINATTVTVSSNVNSTNITVTGDTIAGDLLIRNNEIQNSDPDQDIQIISLGTGALEVDCKLKVTEEIVQTARTISSSVGSAGDVAGMIASDNNYIYRCTGTYDGSTAIWKRISLSSW